MKKLEVQPKHSYVYICYINKTPVYVGKGRDNRYLHCVSGNSHNPKLNDALIQYGYDAFEVEVVKDDLIDYHAFQLESYWINELTLKGYELFNVPKLEKIRPQSSPDISVIPWWVTEVVS